MTSELQVDITVEVEPMALRYDTAANSQEECSHPSKLKPERGFLASVLYRAYQDLFPITKCKDRCSAIQWFEEARVNEPYFLSFQNIVDILELSAAQIEQILLKVEASKSYQKRVDDKFEAEGKTRGARHLSLVERKRDSLSETLGTVSRRPRFG